MSDENLHQMKTFKDVENSQEKIEIQDKFEEQKDETMGTLITNTFSLIYTADTTSSAFWISISFTIFQLIMPILVLTDQINREDPINPLGVPNNVAITVKIAGFMALSLSLAMFWDLMDAIEKLLQGPILSQTAAEEYPCATPRKFYLAFTLQLIFGILFLIAIFTLIVQSTSVVGMFLNFAALKFITEIDDITFELAARGYVGKSMNKECKKVENFRYPQPKRIYFRRTVYASLTLLLFTMYGFILVQQARGRFDCRRVEVQFGDGFISFLQVFSGYYTYLREFHHSRPIYKDESGKAFFRYCWSGKSGYWVFGFIDQSHEINNLDDLCKSFILRTPHTSGFGLLDIPSRDWLIRKDGGELEYSVDYFTIRCADCDKTTCNGSCQDNICVCGDEYHGRNCQFSTKLCRLTDYDRNTSPFSGAGTLYSSEFTLLENSHGKAVFAYGRPLYAHIYPPDHTRAGWADILMNMGRRYAIFAFHTDNLFPNATNLNVELANYLQVFHPYYDWWAESLLGSTDDMKLPVFISSTVDIGTTTDSISPVGLQWFRIQSNANEPLIPGTQIDTVLICAECDDLDYQCMNFGACANETRTCNCINGYEGSRCEKDPSCILAGDCDFIDELYNNHA